MIDISNWSIEELEAESLILCRKIDADSRFLNKVKNEIRDRNTNESQPDLFEEYRYDGTD